MLNELKAIIQYHLSVMFLKDDSWDMGAERTLFGGKWFNDHGIFNTYEEAIKAGE